MSAENNGYTGSTVKALLIGCGPHATHFYLPSFLRYKTELNAEITAVLDLNGQQERVASELKRLGSGTEAYFTEPSGFEELSQNTKGMLDALLLKKVFNAVIIATDPVNHKNYASWALRHGLPVLMDKPVTTRENAVNDAAQAQGILKDYEDLLSLHKTYALKRPFVLCAHRRYHPGILFVRDLIREVSKETHCPVTNIHSYHSDGQWRLPHEIRVQKHHSYNQGHGKISHSGFHFIDCVEKFWEEGLASGKAADDVEVFSSFLRPRGLLEQLTREDYLRLFGDEYGAVCPETDEQLSEIYQNYGEVDAAISLAMRRNGEPFSLASINLIHNGFSRRSWLNPGTDLYKGNGRVKHEEHIIHIGPFICVQVHSYQSKDDHDKCEQSDDEPGGNNHYEIHIFRNSRMIGGKAFERLTLKDLPDASGFSSERLYITQVKERSIKEWIGAIHSGQADSKKLLSSYTDHLMPVRLMSAIYQSFIMRKNGQNPVCVVPWRLT